MKKSKVKKITKWDRKEGYKDTSFTIDFENGDSGFYSSKDEDQKRFIVGQEAEYSLEEKEGKNGKKYNRVTSPLDEKTTWSGGGGGNKKPQIEPRIQMISFAAAYTKDLIVGNKVAMTEFEKEFTKIYNVMVSKI